MYIVTQIEHFGIDWDGPIGEDDDSTVIANDIPSPLTEEQDAALNTLLVSLDTNQDVINDEGVMWLQYQVAKEFVCTYCSIY